MRRMLGGKSVFCSSIQGNFLIGKQYIGRLLRVGAANSIHSRVFRISFVGSAIEIVEDKQHTESTGKTGYKVFGIETKDGKALKQHSCTKPVQNRALSYKLDSTCILLKASLVEVALLSSYSPAETVTIKCRMSRSAGAHRGHAALNARCELTV